MAEIFLLIVVGSLLAGASFTFVAIAISVFYILARAIVKSSKDR